MEVNKAVRAFTYNKIPLTDPDPKLSIEEVRTFYANIYPEITTAEIEGPEQKDNKLVYTFRRAVGTKGARPTVAEYLQRVQSGADATDKPRGNSISATEFESGMAFASACDALLFHGFPGPFDDELPQRLALPSAALLPLP